MFELPEGRQAQSKISGPLTIDEIVAQVRAHPFVYGISHLLSNPGALVFKSPSEPLYIAIGPLPKVSDRVWYGNCWADVAMSCAALERHGLHKGSKVEELQFTYPQCDTQIKHFRLVTPFGIIEHSNFFPGLSPTTVGDFKMPSLDQGSPLAVETLHHLAAPLFVHEFKVVDDWHLLALGVSDSIKDGASFLKVECEIFRREGEKVQERCDIELLFPRALLMNEHERSYYPETLATLSSAKMKRVMNGESSVITAMNEKLLTEVALQVDALLQCVNRGFNFDRVSTLLREHSQQMGLRPGWWWKR